MPSRVKRLVKHFFVMWNQLWINAKYEVCYFCTPFKHEKWEKINCQLFVLHALVFLKLHKTFRHKYATQIENGEELNPLIVWKKFYPMIIILDQYFALIVQ